MRYVTGNRQRNQHMIMKRSRHAATLFQYLKKLQEAAVMTDVPLLFLP